MATKNLQISKGRESPEKQQKDEQVKSINISDIENSIKDLKITGKEKAVEIMKQDLHTLSNALQEKLAAIRGGNSDYTQSINAQEEMLSQPSSISYIPQHNQQFLPQPQMAYYPPQQSMDPLPSLEWDAQGTSWEAQAQYQQQFYQAYNRPAPNTQFVYVKPTIPPGGTAYQHEGSIPSKTQRKGRSETKTTPPDNRSRDHRPRRRSRSVSRAGRSPKKPDNTENLTICNNYDKNGYCVYGIRCRFYHDYTKKIDSASLRSTLDAMVGTINSLHVGIQDLQKTIDQVQNDLRGGFSSLVRDVKYLGANPRNAEFQSYTKGNRDGRSLKQRARDYINN